MPFGWSVLRQRVVVLSCLGAAALAALGYFVLRAPERESVPAKPRYAELAPRLKPEDELTPPKMPRELELKQIYTLNHTAFIPPQCYTKTTDDGGKAHNPCYTCHVSSRAPNYINDADIQLAYAFVPRARRNPWKNLLVDWRPQIAGIGDEDILAYIRKSNYFDENRNILLASRLAATPKEWDWNENGRWEGFVPDARFEFDDKGFDRGPDGGYTGWRAFAYYPVPGTFWPTNGSIGDVLIRLPEAFRRSEAGAPDLRIYELNLAILEAIVTRRPVAIEASDESKLGVDLDQDGKLGRSSRVAFVDTQENGPMSYVGQARLEQVKGGVHLAAGLYPEGTEFLHTVRYVDPTPAGMALSARLKELRYAKKLEWWTYARLDKRAKVEAVSKVDSPTELRSFGGNIEIGVNNAQGWTYQGFIEDERGDLRPQSFEETVYCVGCHGGVGVVDDGIFSFSRRLGADAHQEGWYHWSQRGLEGVRDRRVHGGATEYVTYLEQNGAGDEFRQNTEILRRFFDESGKLKAEMKARVESDVTQVLMPSRERALALNKAYSLLVKRQTFRLGRELVLDGAKNVHHAVEAEQTTGVLQPIEPAWSASLTAQVTPR